MPVVREAQPFEEASWTDRCAGARKKRVIHPDVGPRHERHPERDAPKCPAGRAGLVLLKLSEASAVRVGEDDLLGLQASAEERGQDDK